jgi:hypothetical protein
LSSIRNNTYFEEEGKKEGKSNELRQNRSLVLMGTSPSLKMKDSKRNSKPILKGQIEPLKMEI